MPMHPLPILLNNGVSVALCCDDPAVFGNLGLSYDFSQVSWCLDGTATEQYVFTTGHQVLVSSEITGLTSLGIMALESLLVNPLVL